MTELVFLLLILSLFLALSLSLSLSLSLIRSAYSSYYNNGNQEEIKRRRQEDATEHKPSEPLVETLLQFFLLRCVVLGGYTTLFYWFVELFMCVFFAEHNTVFLQN